MARVLLPHEQVWYDELKAVGYYGESELERELQQHVSSLFPAFHVFPFKKGVAHSITGAVRIPDLGMVRRDLRSWGIIEVEFRRHTLTHVLDQIDCFANGEYNAPEIAEYIRQQLRQRCGTRVALSRLQALLSSEPPLLLVIVDADKEAWRVPLEGARADLCIFEIFKNPQGQHLYRTFGGYPSVPTRDAQCRNYPLMRNTLEIVGGFHFKKVRRLKRSRQVDIVFNDILTRWFWLEDNGQHYLRFSGTVYPLSANATYVLFADRNERYYFKVN